MTLTAAPERVDRLATIRPVLLRNAAIGGLLGGAVLFLVMAGYNGSTGMGFWAILNSCFAAFVFKSAQVAPTHQTSMHAHGMSMHAHGMGMGMGNEPVVASHVVVGGLLHLAVSVVAGVAFAIALAVLLRVGVRALASPVLYVLGGALGGALLYLVMMEVVAPNLNRTIVDSTSRTPFFFAHLAFGATVAAWTYWRTVAADAHMTVRAAGGYAHA